MKKTPSEVIGMFLQFLGTIAIVSGMIAKEAYIVGIGTIVAFVGRIIQEKSKW